MLENRSTGSILQLLEILKVQVDSNVSQDNPLIAVNFEPKREQKGASSTADDNAYILRPFCIILKIHHTCKKMITCRK